ncbi:hypothetical protein GS498_20955 [Rhodococcus hoagii]|nr:hypothetical protein [Prescottella equi]
MNITTLLWLAVRDAERLAEESLLGGAVGASAVGGGAGAGFGDLQGDLVETVDGVVDTTYIVMGIANRFGFDFDAAWGEVHSSNLAKFPGGVAVLDATGKLKKPEGWLPPDRIGWCSRMRFEASGVLGGGRAVNTLIGLVCVRSGWNGSGRVCLGAHSHLGRGDGVRRQDGATALGGEVSDYGRVSRRGRDLLRKIDDCRRVQALAGWVLAGAVPDGSRSGRLGGSRLGWYPLGWRLGCRQFGLLRRTRIVRPGFGWGCVRCVRWAGVLGARDQSLKADREYEDYCLEQLWTGLIVAASVTGYVALTVVCWVVWVRRFETPACREVVVEARSR